MPRAIKPKKGASKAKAVVIDFSSPEKAAASVDWADSESWLEEGIRQEENGERYQHGPKAHRHYSNAVVCYAVASSRQASFDSLFNAGRVLFLLATDHVPSPCPTLLEAIAAYRAALALEELRPAPSPTNIIDAEFNLAAAFVALSEATAEGATDGSVASGGGTAVQWATEAKATFADVERRQRLEMDKVFFSGPLATEVSEEEMLELDADPSSTAGLQVEGTMMVTPSLLIDTILESVSNNLSLYPLVDDPALLTLDLVAALDRLATLRELIPASQPNEEQDLAVALTHLNVAVSCEPTLFPSSPYHLSPAEISARYESLIATKPLPELCAEHGDYLLESFSATSPVSQLEAAERAFQTSYATLQNRFPPPRNMPYHVLPSLLSANLAARAHIYLLLHHHHLSTSPTLAQTSLDTAVSLAIQAVEVSGAGIKVVASATGLRLTKQPSMARDDWRTIKATHEALFWLVRIRLRSCGNVRAAGLEAVATATARDVQRDAARFVDDVRGDAAWVAAGEGIEEKWWAS